jgi:hypothetical protein
VTNALAADGWAEQATPLEGALVRCEVCGQTTAADEVAIDSLGRIEGASDPGDMAAVVAFTCAHCDAKDVLVLKYGPDATAAEADVLLGLADPPAS